MKARGSGKHQGESVRQQAHHRKTIKIKLLRNSITDMQRRSKQASKYLLAGGRGCLWWAPWGSQRMCCGWRASIGCFVATSTSCLAPQILTYRSLEALVSWEMSSALCLPQGTRAHKMWLISLSKGWCRGSVGKQGGRCYSHLAHPTGPTIPLVQRKELGSCSTCPSTDSEEVLFTKGLGRSERRAQSSGFCFAGKDSCSQLDFMRVLKS